MPPRSEAIAWCAARLAEASARAGLRGCDAVGPGARVFGQIVVANLGNIVIGDAFVVASRPVRTHIMTANGGSIRIGHRVQLGHGSSIFAQELVEIGEGTCVGPMVMILDVDFHEVKDRNALSVARPIRIGRDVRIGSGVVILRGATIGDGARIAPNSVVARAVPANTYAEGVPARPSQPPEPRLKGGEDRFASPPTLKEGLACPHPLP